MKRRGFLTTAAAAALLPAQVLRGQASAARVTVVGGGFAGASCARSLRRADPRIVVTLVEQSTVFHACPMSNAVIAGLREMDRQRFTYKAVQADGVALAPLAATAVDPRARSVALSDGTRLGYDRLILAPGIDLRWDALPGYDEAAAEQMPHAWQAGEQTLLLRRQLQAMDDGGLVVISAPAGPYRCPPGPYERASLIAWYLKAHKPRSKVIVLDAKDKFSKQQVFLDAWSELYPGLIEWVPLSRGGQVVSVEPATRTLVTDFDRVRAAVANVIAPQKAGRIAAAAGVANRSGWCPIDPVTFESRLQPNIHVIGDAAITGAMPKSAFGAHAEAKHCALAVAALLAGREPASPTLSNACFSLVAPDYGISVAGIYRPDGLELAQVPGSEAPGSGGPGAADSPRASRAFEARNAEAGFRTLTAEVFE
ncbi:MAG TPA: NAD(P)/FAD-dependent oxidoreductase [Burkholderiaceae bacterium]|nr:NAD(P)/FAD-dependent oxidoreductase [Burkholderiaceae bacterium]